MTEADDLIQAHRNVESCNPVEDERGAMVLAVMMVVSAVSGLVGYFCGWLTWGF